jgi:glycosyltransferase involved in cell wall biosynthesis
MMAPTSPAGPPDRFEDARVFVDAGPFSYDRLTGLSRYTARLTLALAGLVPVHFFSESEGMQLIPPDDLDWSRDQDLAVWAKRVWRSQRVPLGPAPPNGIGLYCTLRPMHHHFPFEVSVLHDFSPYTVPHTHLDSTRDLFGGFFSKALPVSDLAIAVSHSTKADAAWLSPMDPDRVIVAHSGPSLCVGQHEHREPVRRQPNVGLVVSTLEPRKNAQFLFDWFLNSKLLPGDAELWWVGPIGWLTSHREMQGSRKAGRRIKFLGVVSDQELCRLYQTAGWSIYPSLYEGFGFPVLDPRIRVARPPLHRPVRRLDRRRRLAGAPGRWADRDPQGTARPSVFVGERRADLARSPSPVDPVGGPGLVPSSLNPAERRQNHMLATESTFSRKRAKHAL